MTRGEAIQAAREALAAWGGGKRTTVEAAVIMADALRDLLAVEATVLTEEERAQVDSVKMQYKSKTFGALPVSEKDLLAIIDRLCPPEPNHKVCPFCGGGAEMQEVDRVYWAQCVKCGVNRLADGTEAEAWASWDRRTP